MSNGGDAAKNVPTDSTPPSVNILREPIEENEEDEEYDNSWNTIEYWEGVAESAVRVTTAGFCGSLIGLAKERQASAALSDATTANALKIIAPTTTALPRRPPVAAAAPRRTSTTPMASNLPFLWSIRCMLLATILETSRTLSPTRQIWDEMVAAERMPPAFRDDIWVRPAVLALGDYSLGGAVAGLAGAITSRQRSWRFGLGTGLALGLLAGTLQAAMDVAAVYVQREQQRAIERKEQASQN